MSEKPARPPLPPAEPTTDALRELTAAPRWVLWRYEWVKDKWTKVPYRPTGARASSTDPETWVPYAEARAVAETGSYDGVGYVVYRGDAAQPDDVVGVDLDHCVDPATGDLTPEADAIVAALDSYTETTPSGTGLRVYVRGTLPVDGGKRNGLELYQHGRYFTVTGQHATWSPPEIRDAQPALDALYRRVFGEPKPREPKPVRSSGLTDGQVLDLMFDAQGGDELRALYAGDDGPYGSQSEGDLRLCGALAFWTGRDAAQIDRLFRGSARMRPKWDERHRADGATYGEMTIGAAVAGTEDVYEAPAPTATVKLPSRNGAHPEPTEDDETPAPRRTEKRPWPAPMGPAAFAGLAGETVRALEPYTEGDQHGLLVSVLTAFGCMLNSGPYLLHGSTVHWPRLFALVVGNTGDGRKGESWQPVRRLILHADNEFRPRVQGGLSSGEGLISAVRDPAYGVVKGEVVLTDEGVPDKRLLVFESEFARVLAVLNRETNTLGAIVRDAWDTGDLAVMTKTQLRVTGAHISILGHCTPEELVANCDASWITNGFLNRFLVAMVRRSRLLPIPRALDGDDLNELARAWSSALAAARQVGRVTWSPAGRAWWEERYQDFLTTETGKLGAMKVRAAPIVLRLALTYALMAGEKQLSPPHLEAAEDVWRYCERSVEYLFGESTGNATADVIFRYLRQQLQLTKTDIHRLFNRHKEAHEIDAALTVLEQAGYAYRKYTVPKGGGRIETWYLQD